MERLIFSKEEIETIIDRLELELLSENVRKFIREELLESLEAEPFFFFQKFYKIFKICPVCGELPQFYYKQPKEEQCDGCLYLLHDELEINLAKQVEIIRQMEAKE